MQTGNLLTFILAGLLTVAVGEYQVNVLVLDKGLGGYASALLIYAVAVALMYAMGRYLDARVSLKNGDVVYYLFGGIFGLAIEWFVIGNGPWVGNGAIQAGMFAWWSATFLVPRIFTVGADPVIRTVRQHILISLAAYAAFSTVIVALSPENMRAGVTGILLSIGYIILNFQFIPYLVRNGFSRTSTRAFMWFIALSALVGLFI